MPANEITLTTKKNGNFSGISVLFHAGFSDKFQKVVFFFKRQGLQTLTQRGVGAGCSRELAMQALNRAKERKELSIQWNMDTIIRAVTLEGILPGLVHGFSTNLPLQEGNGFSDALKNLLYESWSGARPEPVTLEQPHGREILGFGDGAGHQERVPTENPASGYDGAVAELKHGPLLSVRVADCVPVLAVDPELSSYAVLHAGWRGTAAGIFPNLLNHWRGKGSSLGKVRVALGPSIRQCCFEVRDDCISAFSAGEIEGALAHRDGSSYLDLGSVLLAQARAAGLSPGQVETLPFCTCCHGAGAGDPPFASYRRSGRQGLPTGGRNAAFIGVRAGS